MTSSANERLPRKRLQKNGAATLQDVAVLAEVSSASVSRYFNAPLSLRPEMRRRIEVAVEQLGYVPHGAARALASQRSHTIGAVIPTLDNAIFAHGVQALQQRLDLGGYTLLMASSNYDLEQEARQVEVMVGRGVDGLMLVGAQHAERIYPLLAAKNVPVVNTWAYGGDSQSNCVGFNNFAALRRLTGYLIDLGHRCLAMIAGVTHDNDRARDRVRGFWTAVAEAGLTLPPECVVESRYDIVDGRAAMRHLLAGPVRPTAVVCGNDVLALGALLECQANGVAVPDEISITGFDDLALASHMVPPLTTMRIPSWEMGERAADILLAQAGRRGPPVRVELDVDLIVRGSTAPPTLVTKP